MKLKDLLLENYYPTLDTLSPAAWRCYNKVINKFGKSTFKNIWGKSVRNIDGTDTVSQHSYGNALDFMVYNDKDLGTKVKDYLLSKHYDLDIENIIWYREIWSAPNFTKHQYTGKHSHKDHVHVDFISIENQEKESYINKKNNKYLTDLIASYHYISSTQKGAEEYFGSFRSWNPLSAGIGDDEEGAANKLLSRFDKYYEPELKRIQSDSATSNEDKKNIQKIREIIDILTEAILNGDSVQFDVLYHEYNVTTNSYILKSKMFNWNYM